MAHILILEENTFKAIELILKPKLPTLHTTCFINSLYCGKNTKFNFDIQ